MSPGGHLVTTAAACAATVAITGSWPLAAAVAAGGFLIDVDHAVDYVLFERQRDLRPGAFLRYYVEGRIRRTVLVLHSYELFALLGALAWLTASPLLGGYLVGALMHLALDITFNGRLTPHSIVAYYSFGYRLAHRFDARALLGDTDLRPAPAHFWSAFFVGSQRESPLTTETTEALLPHRARLAAACGYSSSRMKRISGVFSATSCPSSDIKPS